MHGQELHSVILMGPFSIFYGSIQHILCFCGYFASAHQPCVHASSSHWAAAPATGKHGAITSLPTLWAAPATGIYSSSGRSIYSAILFLPTLILLEATMADSSSSAVSGDFHPCCRHCPHGAAPSWIPHPPCQPATFLSLTPPLPALSDQI